MVKWDLNMRLVLQRHLKQDYSLTKIVEMWKEMGDKYSQISLPTISSEVKRGVSEDEYKDRRWIKYNPYKVYQNIIGEDAVEYLRQYSEANEYDE